jgi:hypothetical protein
MLHLRASRLGIAAAAALLGIAAVAAANDGVVELNQAKIEAAGGFPYTIGHPGSYVLTSNLTVVEKVTALTIAASGVSLDLNGFSIVGSGIGCPGSESAIGVSGTLNQIVIENGIVEGFCFGIMLSAATEVRVERMNVTTLGNSSIFTGVNAILRGNHFKGPNSGVSCPSIVVDTSFSGSSGNNAIPTTTCAKSNLIGNF